MKAAPEFKREQVEAAWNAGAELVLQDPKLQLSDRDTDLVNLVCNAIGTCLDHPETDSLDTVILSCYEPEVDEDLIDPENADEARIDIVKGWINS